MVNHPRHYEGSTSLECIEVMPLVLGVHGTMDFCLGNAFKYLWRYKNKNGEQDLDKAAWYLRKWYELNACDVEVDCAANQMSLLVRKAKEEMKSVKVNNESE